VFVTALFYPSNVETCEEYRRKEAKYKKMI
jgi:hypothetical protein